MTRELEKATDPELRRRLEPTHPFGCKRPLFSNEYFAAFNDPRLELVTDSIERITPRAPSIERGHSSRD